MKINFKQCKAQRTFILITNSRSSFSLGNICTHYDPYLKDVKKTIEQNVKFLVGKFSINSILNI